MDTDSRFTVMNVSSDLDSLYFSSRLLRSAGLHVIESSSVEAAVAHFRQHPDLLVIDTRGNHAARCDLCGALATFPEQVSPPILHLVSGAADVCADAKCALRSRRANLHWPASPQSFIGAVQQLLRSSTPIALAGRAGRESETDMVGQLAAVASYQVDAAGIVQRWSQAAEQLFGWKASEVLGLFLPIIDTDQCPEFINMLDSVVRGQALYRWEVVRRTKQGNLLSVAVSMAPITDSAGRVRSVQIVAADISELKQLQSAQKAVEQQLRRTNRLYAVLSQCNQELLRHADESELLAAICQLLNSLGGYRFAMISLLNHDAEQTLHAAAWAGDEAVVASELVTSWNELNERGRSPTGTAVRTGKSVIRHDMDHHLADYQPWQTLNQRLQLRSMMAAPVLYAGTCYGALSLYSIEKDIFDSTEVRLLEELAIQLAYGLHALRTQAASRDATQRLSLFASAIEATLDAVMVTDAQAPNYPIVYINLAFSRITGYAADDVLGRSGHFLLADDMQQPELELIRSALRRRESGQAVLRCYRRDGSLFWNELHVAPVINAAGVATHYISVLRDISDRVTNETRLSYLATHDLLTGLANRTLLNDRLQQAIARAERDTSLIAVLLIDLDQFKEINDRCGNLAGDMLLQSMAARMQTCVRECDTLARLGGDQFVILLSDIENAADLVRIGQKLRDVLAAPLSLDGQEICVTTSIGACLYPNDTRDANELLRLADRAMQQIKESGRNDFRCYSSEQVARSSARLSLQGELRSALDNGELCLYYQPKADLYSGAISGAEALIRWQHPERGLISPAHFIPLAEQTGLILPIGEWVLHEACRQARQWQLAGIPMQRIAVNLSARQLRQGNLVDQIEKVLVSTGLDPCWLELELTESMVMENLDSSATVLKRLKGLGVMLSMDDFGTGYSSLGYLRLFPFDTLKIDRSFVQNVISEPDDALIARAVIAMAHSLRLHVIAEGVESVAQMRFLRAHLCDAMQGYLFSQPLPADKADAFLRRGQLLDIGTSQSNGGARPDRTLLLVDDEPDIRNAIRRLLRRSGYRILTAESGAEALEIMALNDVQVILSDQRMPVMSGSELLGKVKTLYPDTVRMMLSGYTELSSLTDAINRGAIYQFISKPWDDEELRMAIHQAFVMRDEREANAGMLA